MAVSSKLIVEIFFDDFDESFYNDMVRGLKELTEILWVYAMCFNHKKLFDFEYLSRY